MDKVSTSAGDLAQVEQALLDAIAAGDVESALTLATERDDLLRAAMAGMDADALAAMARTDQSIRGAFAGCRQQLTGELAALRRGRNALSAYGAVTANA